MSTDTVTQAVTYTTVTDAGTLEDALYDAYRALLACAADAGAAARAADRSVDFGYIDRIDRELLSKLEAVCPAYDAAYEAALDAARAAHEAYFAWRNAAELAVAFAAAIDARALPVPKEEA